MARKSSEVGQKHEIEQVGRQSNGRNYAVPRDKHTTEGSQARLAPARDIQGRLGPKRRMEDGRKERSAAPDTKTH